MTASCSLETVQQALDVLDSATSGQYSAELRKACCNGDTSKVGDLLAQGADARHQDDETGCSAMMLAAKHGHADIVSILLRSGAPWNAQDRQDRCAGDFATAAGHSQAASLMLNWACTAERILRDTAPQAALDTEGAAYLQQPLHFDSEKILDAGGEAVMMAWEKPLMLAHANLICQNGGHILNVGFGMGLIDDAIQQYDVKSHTIIEAHPDIYQRMLSLGWGDRPNVTILFGRWQDVAERLGQYDGIFFDTYSEHYVHMQQFHALLPRILRADGLYSFFNGLAPRCQFFHTVYTKIVADDLAELGFATQYMELPVDTGGAEWQKEWVGVQSRYWWHRAYHLPIVYWRDDDK